MTPTGHLLGIAPAVAGASLHGTTGGCDAGGILPDITSVDDDATPVRPRRRGPSPAERVAVVVLAVVAAVAAVVLSDAEPVGVDVLDAALVAGGVALLTVVASSARRWTLALVGGAAALLTVGAWALVGVAALVAALVDLQLPRRNRVLGAAVGAGCGLALLHQDTGAVAHGIPTLVALAGCLPAAVTALAHQRSGVRRAVRRTALAVAGLVLLAGAGGALAAAQARADVEAAIDDSREARRLVVDDQDAAVAAFRRSAAGFADAADAVDAPWALPARGLPIVAQHLRAVEDLAGSGAVLATASADTVEELDLASLRFVGGRLDVDRVEAMASPARDLVASAVGVRDDVARADDPWLVAPVQDRIDELAAELDDAIGSARDAVEAVEAAPWLLGADAPRTYAVLFSSPAESRELGGLVGSFGTLTADDGRITFDALGAATELRPDLLAADPEPPEGVRLPTAYRNQQPLVEPRAWGGTVDFPTVAATTRAALDAIDRPVDGVLFLDPYVVEALAAFSGPVRLPEVGRTVAPTEVLGFLLRDQYALFDADLGTDAGAEIGQGGRKDLLGDVAEQVFDRLVGGALPGPPVVARALSPLVDQRRLLLTVTDPAADAVLARAGLTGPFAPDDQPTAAGEERFTLGLTDLLANKLDAYVTRTVEVRPEVDLDGEVTGTITVHLDNDTPAPATLPGYVVGAGDARSRSFDPGTHFVRLSLYSTLDVVSVEVNGTDAVLGAEPAYGATRYGVLATVPRGRRTTVTFTLADQRPRREPLELTWVPNAAALPEVVVVEVARR